MPGKTMKAVYLDAPRRLRMTEEPIPQVTDPHEALIRVGSVGVCGSDCHFYDRGRIGRFVVTEPIILGHECAGTIVEVGSAVEGLAAGDRVAVEPGYPCRRCRRCREGRYNLCEHEVTFMATPGSADGAFREYLTWPADFLYPLPEELSLEDGAMIEPLAVGVHACRRGGVEPGLSAAVLGAGPIGLLAAQAAGAYGARPVVITDVVGSRVEFARKLELEAVNAAETDPVEAIRERTRGGADVVIETAGTAATLRQAMAAVRTGGVVVPVGMLPHDEAELPVMDMIGREYDLRPVFRYANCYRPALSLVEAGKIRLAPLRTHEFPLEKVEAAIRTAIEQKAEAIKVMVRV